MVEAAAGQNFLWYMKQHVFDPLGMNSTVADYSDSIVPHRTRFYQRTDDGRVVNAPYVDNSYKWAGGGFLSTPSDLMRFAFAHFRDDFLDPKTIALLWTPQTTNSGESTGYGIGWAVRLEDGVVVRAGHGGGSVGGTTGFMTRPREGVAVALVGNMSQAPTGGLIVTLITDAFLDPEAVAGTGDGADMTGNFECFLTGGSDEVIRVELELGGSPERYWGQITWNDNTVDRVIFSASRLDETRLVTVDGRGRLMELRFTTTDDNGLRGSWRRGRQGESACKSP